MRIAGRPSLLLLAVLLAASALRIVALLDLRANDPLFPSRQLVSDGLYYHEWAAALAGGREFGPEPANRPYWIPPLYPQAVSLLYRAFGPRPLAIVLAQHLLGLLGLVLVHRLARGVAGESAALLAASLAALYLPFVFFEGKPMAETLAGTLVLGGLVLLAEGSVPAGAGVLLGLAACARPQLLLAIPAAALPLAPRSRRRALLPFLAGAALAPGAILARNLAVSGQGVLVSANGGVNFHFGNHSGVRGTFHAPGAQWSSIFEQRATALREAERESGAPVNEGGASAHFFRRGLAWITGHPADALLAWGRKACALLGNDEIEIVYSPSAEREVAPSLRLFFVPFAAIAGLAAVGIVRRRRHAGSRGTVLLLFVAANVLAALAFFPYSRFRLLLLPALLPFAGAGGIEVVRDLRARRIRRAPFLGLLVAGLSLVAPRGEAKRLLAGTWIDLGTAYRAERMPSRAEAAYRRSIEIFPANAKARIALAELFEGNGDDRAAEAELLRAGEGSAYSAEARYRLAVLYMTSRDASVRRPEAARAILEDLLRADPGHYEARCGLGTWFLGRGAFAEALVHFERAAREFPDRAEAWRGLSHALEALGRPEEAAAARRRAAGTRRGG